jgi:hypothetical protein
MVDLLLIYSKGGIRAPALRKDAEGSQRDSIQDAIIGYLGHIKQESCQCGIAVTIDASLTFCIGRAAKRTSLGANPGGISGEDCLVGTDGFLAFRTAAGPFAFTFFGGADPARLWRRVRNALPGEAWTGFPASYIVFMLMSKTGGAP